MLKTKSYAQVSDKMSLEIEILKEKKVECCMCVRSMCVCMRERVCVGVGERVCANVCMFA